MKKKILAAAIVVLLLALPVYAAADDVSGNMGKAEDTVSSGDLPALGYYDALLDKKTEEREYLIYQYRLQVQLLDAQLAYLEGVAQERAQKCGIEEKKLEMGYTVPVAVEEAKSAYAAVQYEIESVKDRREYYREGIALYGGEYQEISVPNECEPLTDDYVQKFLEGNVQEIYYAQQIAGYEAALRNANGNAAETEILRRQLQLALMEKEQYEANLELYVKGLMLQYKDIERKIAGKDDQIAVARMKTANAALLYEKGKITELELIGLQNELQRLCYERLELRYQAKEIHYRLSHGIEEQ